MEGGAKYGYPCESSSDAITAGGRAGKDVACAWKPVAAEGAGWLCAWVAAALETADDSAAAEDRARSMEKDGATGAADEAVGVGVGAVCVGVVCWAGLVLSMEAVSSTDVQVVTALGTAALGVVDRLWTWVMAADLQSELKEPLELPWANSGGMNMVPETVSIFGQ